ncbi:hypothetical protein F5Y15DRAFT_107250 [Xylariaceae sp. FL0016]|nr:hypothetical protein F5Y15DRAFT_107250 [Xylariaceae sp. FL0016]
MASAPLTKKRIIMCCDGTWQNSDNGYVEPDKSCPIPHLQIPSNVTRISRSFKRRCSDGTFQIVYYQSGVGSGSGIADKILGGAFGVGISEHVREAYSFICANYVDGDEIFIIGFSRGAFTARSVAGMISDLGLLTREGMKCFYPIFKDMQNWMNPDYDDQFPKLPFEDKPKGEHANQYYRQRLVAGGLTRVFQKQGEGALIRVKAVGVWDTVGALGIPQSRILNRLGIRPSNREYQFYNTNLSCKIEHAFHALALDETRGPFMPTLWERNPEAEEAPDLRQVWFPGSHANIGGGWEDQGVANSTLAWMMDQLASVGCEFTEGALDMLFEENVAYYRSQSRRSRLEACEECCLKCCKSDRKKPLLWACEPVYKANTPVRPWSLGAIRSVQSPIYDVLGGVTRTPGMYHKINPKNGRRTAAFLEDTNERIHSSVRVRLACEGLGLDDKDRWMCAALLKKWQPKRVPSHFYNPVPVTAAWGPKTPAASGAVSDKKEDPEAVPKTAEATAAETIDATSQDGMRWVWEYVGPEKDAPIVKTMIEENLGPFEQHLLALYTADKQMHVYKFAEQQNTEKLRLLDRKMSEKVLSLCRSKKKYG